MIKKKGFCPNCEREVDLVHKKVEIPIGTEVFCTKMLVCCKCGSYEITPEVRKKMDEWGRKLTKNIIEPQPLFSEAVHQFAEEMAAHYGLKRVPFYRALTAFYLNRIVNREDFTELKRFCENSSALEFLNKGERSKVSIPIRFLLFRKLQIFGQVWNVTPAKAIEEAVLFGLVVLSSKEENFKKLKAIAQNLQQFIQEVAQAA